MPLIPLVEVFDRDGGVEFWHSGPILRNVGVTSSFTVTSSVAVFAHSPDAGVKVYSVVPAVAVFTVPGFQVPVMLFILVPTNTGGVAPSHNGAMASKVGVIGAFTVISSVAELAHCPDDAVKV